MPRIPFSSAPRVGSPNLMTGKLIPVTPKDNPPNPSHSTSRPDINLIDVGSRRLVGGDLSDQIKSDISASDLQNDPKASWVNLWSPKQIRPTTPKTMDNPPPEPPLPHTRRNSFSESNPHPSGKHKLTNPKDEVGQSEENGFFSSVGDRFNDLYNRAGEAWMNATPMEKALAIGIPTALAAGAGALYLRKKKRDANHSSKK